jgi:hypothetical protein
MLSYWSMTQHTSSSLGICISYQTPTYAGRFGGKVLVADAHQPGLVVIVYTNSESTNGEQDTYGT